MGEDRDVGVLRCWGSQTVYNSARGCRGCEETCGPVLAWCSLHKSILLIEWNLIRLGDLAHGIVTKTVHKTLTGVCRVQGVWGM